MPDQTDLDGAWLDWLRTGNEARFGKLFVGLYPQLVAFAFRILQNRESAEDVVQNLFINLMERGRNFRINGPLRNYLYGAVRNEALTLLKRESMLNTVSLDNALNLPMTDEEAAGQDEMQATYNDVQRAISRLPDRTRLVFTLSREHGKSQGEIAAILGITVSTVKTQLARAFELLRADLRRNKDD